MHVWNHTDPCTICNNAPQQTHTHTALLAWLMLSVTVLLCAVNPGFSRCRDTSLIFSQAVDTTTAGADLLWSASITNPESQRYSSGSGWPYVSRAIIFNETASNLSACGSRDAWQIRPSESLLLTLIYGSASFPQPVMLCAVPLSACFTWCDVSQQSKDRLCHRYGSVVFVVLKKMKSV